MNPGWSKAGRSAARRAKGALLQLVVGLAAALLAACQSPLPSPRVDFSEPGWQVHHGQAVWKPSRRRPELAGEYMLARHPDGRWLVEFSKMPIPLVVARMARDTWTLDLLASRRRFHGHGPPPPRSAWLVLPAVLDGASAPAGWTFQTLDSGGWTLADSQTGESLQGYLLP
jgi:hypothetical protein